MNTELDVRDFFVVGGTLKRGAVSYVERPADKELLRLTLMGEYCNVLTPRQMGKSSLMVRTAEKLRAQGVRTVIIDLTATGSQVTADQWYLGLVTRLAQQLKLAVDALSWWQSNVELSAVQRFSDFLRQVVLTEIADPIVVFVDEIDSTLKLDFTDDFFAAIRAAYNARASDAEYERLTFVLLGVARPVELIKDRTRTPYNIGTNLDLADLTFEEASKVFVPTLDEVHPYQGNDILRWVFNWTSGQPYLTQKLCAAIVVQRDGEITHNDVDRLVEREFLTEGARKEINLQSVQNRLLTYPHRRELLRLYRRICQNKHVVDDGQSITQNQLKLAGIVKVEDRRLLIRNQIYRQVFDLAWVRKHTQINWARIIAVGASLVAILAVGSILHDTWVAGDVRDATNKFLLRAYFEIGHLAMTGVDFAHVRETQTLPVRSE